MAYEASNGSSVPHADGYDDLLDKLKTFLTTNSSLVSDNEQWTVHNDRVVGTTREVYLSGPGLSNSESIHVNIQRMAPHVPTNAHNWQIRGATSYDSSQTYEAQPNISRDQYFPLSAAGVPIQYWFFANGRRFIIVAKVSTTYLSCYCGFYLPYALPSEFPYPIAIMTGGAVSTAPYNQGDANVSGFFNPKVANNNSIRLVDGYWIRAINNNARDYAATSQSGHVWPNNDWNNPSYNMGLNEDDSYTLLPFILISDRGGGREVLGELDGVCWVSGYNNISENDLVASSKNYKCFQSAEQSNFDEFAAFEIIN